VETVFIEARSIVIRWLHVVAGIARIGSSFYFIHLDLSLKARAMLPEGVRSEAWQVQGRLLPYDEVSGRARSHAGRTHLVQVGPKVAITLAFVGTVVSETVGANAGLGYQSALAGSTFQMSLVFAALLLLAVEGIAMYAVFAYVEVYFTRWAFRSSMSAAA